MSANAFITNTPTHTLKKRRVPLDQFLRTIGIDPAQSTSRNPLESPWSLTAEEFTRRSKLISTYRQAREEIQLLTEEIIQV